MSVISVHLDKNELYGRAVVQVGRLFNALLVHWLIGDSFRFTQKWSARISLSTSVDWSFSLLTDKPCSSRSTLTLRFPSARSEHGYGLSATHLNRVAIGIQLVSCLRYIATITLKSKEPQPIGLYFKLFRDRFPHQLQIDYLDAETFCLRLVRMGASSSFSLLLI